MGTAVGTVVEEEEKAEEKAVEEVSVEVTVVVEMGEVGTVVFGTHWEELDFAALDRVALY